MLKIVRRSQLIGAVFLLLFFVIIYRFYVLQVVDASMYQERAEAMYQSESNLPAERGNVYDRYANPLATGMKAYTVVAILNENADYYVRDTQETAEKLSPILNMSVENLLALLTRDDRYQVELRPGGLHINSNKMQEITDLELEGIHFLESQQRYYPNHKFASHILGFMNQDGLPVMGIESFYDEQLKGKEGNMSFKKDRKGNRLPTGIQGVEPAVDGHDIYLTLDERIQLYAEKALDQAEEQFQPKNMSVIVSNPQTGEILAMASRPSFDPNRYHDIDNYLNQSISAIFEPGSTFKITMLAAAIEEGIYNGQDTFKSGTYSGIPGPPIRDHQAAGWGEITYDEGVQRSSNIAFVKLGEKMGRSTFYDYIHRFGFGQQTGIDLPQEQSGFIQPENAPPRNVATMTFGHGISVTAIQQIQAVNAIANGGKLMTPYIVDKIVDTSLNETIFQGKSNTTNEQVVSEQTATKVRDLLETVVTDGTGQRYYIDGYNVAGKTGTAQKINESGQYISNEYIHSFVGFAPKDDPELVIHVMVDTPQLETGAHVVSEGGAVVAGIFKPIMLQSLRYLKVLPNRDQETSSNIESVSEDTFQEMDDFLGASAMAARQKAESQGYDTHVIGSGSTIERQVPEPKSSVILGERLYLITDSLDNIVVPDFSGWSLKEVLDWRNVTQNPIEMSGSGYVVEQNKEVETSISNGEKLRLTLKPKYEQSDSPDEGNDSNGSNDSNDSNQDS